MFVMILKYTSNYLSVSIGVNLHKGNPLSLFYSF